MRRFLVLLSVVLVCCIVLFSLCFSAFGDSVTSSLVTNHNNVRIRNKASHGDIIAMIKYAGTPLTYIDTEYVEEALWYHVYVGGVEGYVYGKYVDVNGSLDESSSDTVVNDDSILSDDDDDAVYVVMLGDLLNLRKWPNGEFVMAIEGAGTKLKMLDPSEFKREIWYHVSYNGVEGYVYSYYVRKYDPTVDAYDNSVVDMVDSSLMESVGADDDIEALDEVLSDESSGNNVDNMSDIPESAILDGSVYYLKTLGSGVNVRKVPNGEILGSIKESGTRVLCLEPDKLGTDNWYHIYCGGIDGYSYAKYFEVDDVVPVNVNSDGIVDDSVVEATIEPTIEPTVEQPTVEPTVEPSVEPTVEPTLVPIEESVAELSDDLNIEADETLSPTVGPESTVEPEPTVATYGSVSTRVAPVDEGEYGYLRDRSIYD